MILKRSISALTLASVLVAHALTASQAFAQTPNRPVTHSPIQDQGYVGYCWSYATMGMMEGEALKHGKHVVLSPEYVGFYHMFDEMKANWETYRTFARKKPPKKLFGKLVQGIAKTIVSSLFKPSEGAASLIDALTVAKEVGVVPETAFKFKIGKDQQGLENRIGRFIADKLLLKPQLDAYEKNQDQLFEDFATAYGARPPKITDTFTYEGQSYTPKTFMTNYVQFNPDGYKQFKVGPDNHDQMIRAMKQSLAANKSVEIGFIIYEDFETAKKSGRFDEKNCKNNLCTSPVGGHAILAVNTIEDNSGREPMAGVVIKNSWGLQGLDDNGAATAESSAKGFNVITNGYFKMGYVKAAPAANPTPTPSASASPAPAATPTPTASPSTVPNPSPVTWWMLLPTEFAPN